MFSRVLVVSLFLSLFASEGYAQRRAFTNQTQFGNNRFLVNAPNPSAEAQRTILQELLSEDTPALNWPAFPRTWTQFSESSYQETSTSLGITVNGIAQAMGLGVLTSPVQLGVTYRPYNFVYRYTFETSLIAMTSYRGNDVHQDDIVEATEAELHSIFHFDPELNRNFFQTDSNRPMIGFCSIEARLDINISEEFGITYLVGESKSNEGTTQTIKHALYSNFFQIEPHVPISEYMDTYCNGEFKTYARPYVEADFNKLVLETNIHNNPDNECLIESTQAPEGDNSCMAWFANHTRPVKHMTVPRCEIARDGVARCRLRAKENMPCALYHQGGGDYSSEYRRYAEATMGFSFSCDEGTTCTMRRDPLRLGGVIFWPGSASCQ